jgi:hypothetical protein
MARRNSRSGATGRRIRKALEKQEVTGHIVQLVYDMYGRNAVSEAWDEYRCRHSEDDRVAPFEFSAESPFLEHFTSWLAHTWMPAMLPEKLKGSAVADEVPSQTFLSQHPDLDPLLAEYLKACVETPFSFFEVLQRHVGQQVACRDLMSGTRHVVFDRAASKLLRAHQILYARIVEVDGVPLIDAAAPWPIPKDMRPAVLALRELIMEHPSTAAGPTPARRSLAAHEQDLRSFYWGFIEEALKEDSLQPHVRYTYNLHEAAERLLKMRAPRKPVAERRPENKLLRAIPEVREQVASIFADLCENWVNERLPLFGNRTALEAVATPEGRLKVQALVDEMETDFSLLPFSLDPHVFRRVRERLGLPSGDGLH